MFREGMAGRGRTGQAGQARQAGSKAGRAGTAVWLALCGKASVVMSSRDPYHARDVLYRYSGKSINFVFFSVVESIIEVCLRQTVAFFMHCFGSSHCLVGIVSHIWGCVSFSCISFVHSLLWLCFHV